jgi:8-oxo-dGTP pyrophosphatase MutT (NUDIX family)
MNHSCGALLYTINPEGKLGIVLGKEYGHWSLFKGRIDAHESYEECAIREIHEETGGLLHVSKISLDCVFSNRVKTYHIGLVYISYELIEKFNSRVAHENPAFNEKEMIRFFDYETFDVDEHHAHVKIAVKYYSDHLDIILRQNAKADELYGWRSQAMRNLTSLMRHCSSEKMNWRAPRKSCSSGVSNNAHHSVSVSAGSASATS